MWRRCTFVFVAVFFLGEGLAFSQPEKLIEEPNKNSLVIKVDAGELPDGARQRLGKLGGYRYRESFSTATMSGDGKLLAVASPNNGTINIVDIASGTTLQKLQAQLFGGIQNGIAFSPDATSIAVQSFQDMRVWDVATGKQLQVFQQRDGGGRSQAPSFSRDGKIIGIGSERFAANNQKGEVKAFDVASGKVIGPFETLHNYNIRAAIAPDGKTMASWGQYLPRGGLAMANDREAPRTLQLWDLAAGKELRKIVLDFGAQGFGLVANVVYSPDGKTLAVTSGGSTFHLLDAETGKETRRFSGVRGTGGMNGVRFSPDGDILAAFDFNGSLQAWEIKTGKRLDLADGPKSQLLAVGFPGKGRILALGNMAGSLYWWDATVGEKASPFQGHLTPISALAFSPDGKSIISAGTDQQILWWEPETGKELKRLQLFDADALRYGGGGGRSSFALAPNGKFAATVSDSGTGGVRLWNLKTARVVCDFEGPRAYTQTGIAFSPDSSRIAASGSQTPLHIWDIHTGQELPKMPAQKNVRNINLNNSRVAFSPDGKVVAVHVSYYDMMGRPVSDLILWDTVQAKELHRASIPMPNFGIVGTSSAGMAFSTDSRYLGLADSNGSILLMTTTGREVRRLNSTNRNSSMQLAFSADGRFIAAGSSPRNLGGIQNQVQDEPAVEIWELASGLLRDRFKGHTGAITCLAFSPDGATLATGSMDTTVLLWDFIGKGGAKLTPLADTELPDAWKSLATNDAKLSLTIRRLARTPGALAFLKEHFLPSKNESLEEKTLEKLVADLDSTSFKTRALATKELTRVGERAELALKKSLAGKTSLEARRRMVDLLEAMVRHQYTLEEMQAMRGVEVLERIGTTEARAWLTALSKGDPVSRTTQEAGAALKRLER